MNKIRTLEQQEVNNLSIPQTTRLAMVMIEGSVAHGLTDDGSIHELARRFQLVLDENDATESFSTVAKHYSLLNEASGGSHQAIVDQVDRLMGVLGYKQNDSSITFEVSVPSIDITDLTRAGKGLAVGAVATGLLAGLGAQPAAAEELGSGKGSNSKASISATIQGAGVQSGNLAEKDSKNNQQKQNDKDKDDKTNKDDKTKSPDIVNSKNSIDVAAVDRFLQSAGLATIANAEEPSSQQNQKSQKQPKTGVASVSEVANVGLALGVAQDSRAEAEVVDNNKIVESPVVQAPKISVVDVSDEKLAVIQTPSVVSDDKNNPAIDIDRGVGSDIQQNNNGQIAKGQEGDQGKSGVIVDAPTAPQPATRAERVADELSKALQDPVAIVEVASRATENIPEIISTSQTDTPIQEVISDLKIPETDISSLALAPAQAANSTKGAETIASIRSVINTQEGVEDLGKTEGTTGATEPEKDEVAFVDAIKKQMDDAMNRLMKNKSIEKLPSTELSESLAKINKEIVEEKTAAAEDSGQTTENYMPEVTLSEPDLQLFALEKMEGQGKNWQNRAYVVKRFVQAGYSVEAGMAFTGGFVVEAAGVDLNPNIKQYGGGPGRGIAQWGSFNDKYDRYGFNRQADGKYRYGTLRWFAEKNGREWNTIETQVDFVLWELENTEKRSGQAAKAAGNDFYKQSQVALGYERSAAYIAGGERRKAATDKRHGHAVDVQKELKRVTAEIMSERQPAAGDIAGDSSLSIESQLEQMPYFNMIDGWARGKELRGKYGGKAYQTGRLPASELEEIGDNYGGKGGKNANGGKNRLLPEAAAAYRLMDDAYFKETGKHLILNNTYRPFEAQGNGPNAAPKGASPHGSGISLDFDSPHSHYVTANGDEVAARYWLNENSWKYGWVNPAKMQYAYKDVKANRLHETWHMDFYGNKAWEQMRAAVKQQLKYSGPNDRKLDRFRVNGKDIFVPYQEKPSDELLKLMKLDRQGNEIK